LGGRPAPHTPEARVVSQFEWEGAQVEVLSITTEPGMEVAAVYARPAGATPAAPATVILGGHDDKRSALESGYARAALQRGPVLVLDPRGAGESAQHENHLTSDSILWGRPLFAQQLWDLLQAGRYLASRPEVEGVSVHGVKDGALLAVYAAALDHVFSAVEARELLASYRYYLEDEQPQAIALCIPDILKVADIPQILALAAPTAVRVEGAVGFGGAVLPEADSRAAMAFAHAIHAVAGGAELLMIE